MKTLKSVLKFWQEIVFMFPVGISITVMLIDIHNGRINDVGGIVVFCLHVILFICLVGQIFWKNKTLTIVLTPLFVLYSFFWSFAFYAMPMSNPKEHLYLRPVLVIGALCLVFVATTMSKKYFQTTQST